MGCGSSSLKGENPTGTNDLTPAPQPVSLKKTETSASKFTTIDYDPTPDPSRAKRPSERAPHEQEISRPSSAVYEKGHHQQAQEDKLEPYHTHGDDSAPSGKPNLAGGADGLPQSQPFANQGAKRTDENEALDPSSAAGEAPRKKSFLARIKDEYADHGRVVNAGVANVRTQNHTDDELMRWRGMDGADLDTCEGRAEGGDNVECTGGGRRVGGDVL